MEISLETEWKVVAAAAAAASTGGYIQIDSAPSTASKQASKQAC